MGLEPMPLVPQTSALPTELYTPYKSRMLDLNQPQVGYEPTLIPDHTGVAEDIGIEPNTLTGTSRLAGGPYRHQGLSSFVFTTGYDPITSDVSDRRSTN